MQKRLIEKKYQVEDFENFLFYKENSKRLLDFIHAKLINLYDISAGQKCSYTTGMKNLVRSIDFLTKAVANQHQATLALQVEATRQADDEREKALSQFNALRAAQDDRQTAKSSESLPPNAHHSTPNGNGSGRPNGPSDLFRGFYGRYTTPSRESLATRTSRGYSRGGRGGTRGRGDGPPQLGADLFRNSTTDESDPANVLVRVLTDGFKSSKPESPDYRGLDKPKLDFFTGDASVYAHWKKKFLLHHEGQSLSDAYMSNALHSLLKGEARAKVEVHFRLIGMEITTNKCGHYLMTTTGRATSRIVAFKIVLR